MRKGVSPDWDSDLKKQRRDMQSAKSLQERISRDAKSNSKSPIKGMDDVDYDGLQRWNYNISKAKAGMAQLRINNVDAQQRERDAKRKTYSEQIGARMKSRQSKSK